MSETAVCLKFLYSDFIKELLALSKHKHKAKLYILSRALRFFVSVFVFIFWPCRAACGILFPRPGIKPLTPAVEAQSLNHWTAREVPELS